MTFCPKCGIFPFFVCEAGPNKEEFCYPCYFWHILDKKTEAYQWLEYQAIAGQKEDVEKWYEANRQDNPLLK